MKGHSRIMAQLEFVDSSTQLDIKYHPKIIKMKNIDYYCIGTHKGRI